MISEEEGKAGISSRYIGTRAALHLKNSSPFTFPGYFLSARRPAFVIGTMSDVAV
jgi:hypothetical protein